MIFLIPAENVWFCNSPAVFSRSGGVVPGGCIYHCQSLTLWQLDQIFCEDCLCLWSHKSFSTSSWICKSSTPWRKKGENLVISLSCAFLHLQSFEFAVMEIVEKWLVRTEMGPGKKCWGTKAVRVPTTREASKSLWTTPFRLAQNATTLPKNTTSKLRKCRQCTAIFKNSSANGGGSVDFWGGSCPPKLPGCAIPGWEVLF